MHARQRHGRWNLSQLDPTTRRGRAVRLFAWLVAGRFAYVVLAAVVMIVVLTHAYLPPLTASEEDVGSVIPADTPALAAEARSVAAFRVPFLSRTVLIQRNAVGISRNEQRATVLRAAQLLRGDFRGRYPGLLIALPVPNEQAFLPVAREDETTIVTYLFFDPSVGWAGQRKAAEAYGRDLPGPDPSVVGVTGLIPARLTQDAAILARLETIEVATVIVIALIVGVTFRSLGAPFVTLTAGVLAYLIALRVVAWAGQLAGFPVAPEMQPLMVVLLLGIVTDYAVFLLAGFRYHLAAGLPKHRAARMAVAEYGPIIIVAGLMVAAGAAALVVATVHIYRAFGPAMALTVLIGLAVAMTLVPALLATLGRLAFWPSTPQNAWAPLTTEEPPPSVRRRLTRLILRRPVAVLVVALTVAALLLASSQLRFTALGFDVLSGLPAGAEPRRAADAAWLGFSRGILSPTEIDLYADGLAKHQQALVRLEKLIAKQADVAGVLGPRERPEQIAAVARSGLSIEPGIIVAPSGGAVRYLVVFSTNPLGSAGIASYNKLRAAMPGLLKQAGLRDVTVAYAGDTAITQQTISRTVTDLVRVGVAAAIVELTLLIIFLRALAAPLYLLGASILAVAASLGITVFLFQRYAGVPDITYFVPFAASVLLVSLGSDYNMFLVGKIWDEARVAPLRQAIETAVPRATRAISVAALALAASFALLALIDVTALRQLAVLLAVGVVVDSFFVRSLLVPALVVTFGRFSAWPWRLRSGSLERPAREERATRSSTNPPERDAR